MKRITPLSVACTAVLALAGFATAFAATPTPTSAVVSTRIYNDCPTSTVTVVNNYPDAISIEDSDLDCFGFANRHIWRFSEDGATAANFDNHSSFRYSATLVISGTGVGEAGLEIAPWYSQNVGGTFNVRTPDGEIAAFGHRLPFYSFTASHGISYTNGQPIDLEIIYEPHGVKPSAPATIEYRVGYQGNNYTSGRIPFDEGNVSEGPVYGNWGILNQSRVGGHFQPRLGNGVAVNVKATWSNVSFTKTPEPNSAYTKTRVYNDCPTSNVTVTNDYPNSICIQDANIDCFGFANRHIWRFSEDGGTTAVEFNNNAEFSYSADVTLSGTGVGEAGLEISPWYSHDVGGTFNVRTPDGEIAVFGHRLPFYSFTASHGISYVGGQTINLGIAYDPNSNSALDPATITYNVTWQGVDYTSGPIAFDQGNPSEEPPYGLYGILNDSQVGGHFQPRLGNGVDVTTTACWDNIRFSTCASDAKVAVELKPKTLNLRSGSPITAYLTPADPYDASDIDVSSVTLNGVPAIPGSDRVQSGTLRLKFDRDAVAATLGAGSPQDVTVAGEISGVCFATVEFVEVKQTNMNAPNANVVLVPGTTTQVRWATPEGEQVQSVTLMSSVDDGATWTIEAASIANTGSYNWTVRDAQTTQARLGIAVLYAVDADGPVTESEFAVSDRFSILAATGVGNGGDASFAMRGIMPNPSFGPMNVRFSLPSRERATLAVYDISGRQVASREVGGLGAGTHTVTLGSKQTLRPGIYMVRLTQLNKSVSTRAVVVE